MDTKNNSATDNNVLTKNNWDEFDPINFRPMPKRYMVWDIDHKKWLKGRSGGYVLDLVDITKELRNNPHLPADCIIVQSTNLFDKDGEEIFEGGIIDYDGDGAALGVVMSIDGQWQLKDKYGNLMFLKGAPHQKLIGHILSNPELMEGK